MNSHWNDNLIIFAMALVSTCFDHRIKIRISGSHRESTIGQTWSKLLKISEELGLGILVEKGTLSALVFKWVVHANRGGEKMIFLGFSGFGMQIEGRQNTISTLAKCGSSPSSPRS